MTHRATCVALLALPLAGCGTLANRAGPDCGRGTVTPSAGCGTTGRLSRRAATRPGSRPTDRPWGAVLPPALYSLDLPLSFAADVLTWPHTTAHTRLNSPVSGPPIAVTPPQAPAAPQAAPAPAPVPPVPAPPAPPVPADQPKTPPS